MGAESTCPRCGEPLGLEAGGERLCGRCLLVLALGGSDDSVAHAQPPDPSSLKPDAAGPNVVSSAHPSHIGPYCILGVLGSGGQGVVYLAEQVEPVKRRVALKLIRPGLDTAQVLRRFATERQALALMTHRGITRILDAGADERGHPYFVMELIEGVPLTHYCDQHRLPTSARLELFMNVCAAVQHAHEKGVIHRDLKPSNILVIEEDGRALPKIIDFGVAKAVGQRLTEATVFTELGAIIGTPEYMSPEQADARVTDIDARTDVYTLGVVLYELLVGAQPFDAATLRRAGLGEVLRVIRDVDPPTPSARLTGLGVAAGDEVARRRRTDLSALRRLLRGELDWVCLKALEKDRNQRYRSATDLADDVRRSLEGQPVRARPPARRYRLRKFCRRHRLPLSAAATVPMAVALGLAAGTLYFSRPHSPAADLQVITPWSIVGVRPVVSPDGKLIVYSQWDPTRQGWSLWLADATTGSTESIYESAGDVIEVNPLRWSRDGRYLYLQAMTAGGSHVERLLLDDRRVDRLGRLEPWTAISADGRRMANIRTDVSRAASILLVANVDGTDERQVAARPIDEPYFAPAWSPDGRSIACSVGHLGLVGKPMRLVSVSLASGREAPLGSDEWIGVVGKVWLPDASGLLVLGQKWGDPLVDVSLWRVDATSGTSRRISSGPDKLSTWYLDLSADGSTLAAVRTRFGGSIWLLEGADLSTTRQLAAAWEGPRFFPDGSLIFTGMDQSLWRTNAAGTGRTRVGQGFYTSVSPDGRHIVYSPTIHAAARHLWRADADGRNAVPITHGPAATHPEISPDGRWVVYITPVDGAVWKVPLAGGEAVRLADGIAADVAVSPDSRWVAVSHRSPEGGPAAPALIRMDGGGVARKLALPATGHLWSLRFARDGGALDVSLGRGVSAGNLWRLPLDGRSPVQLTRFSSEELRSFDWSWDGKTLACLRGGWRGEVVLLRGDW
jgi:serine/threonine protein kinase/Tol biopolymer transport system component